MRYAIVAFVALVLVGCGGSASKATANIEAVPMNRVTGAQWPLLSSNEQGALIAIPLSVRPHCPTGVTLPVLVSQVTDMAKEKPQALAADLANDIVYADGCR